MTPRQVEVVAGGHLVATRAGAVVVVPHRDSSDLTTDSRAAKTWLELNELITQAFDIDGDLFGRAFARLAARWVGEQDDNVEFGVLSPVESGLAVFLHGDVTALIGNESGRPEPIRGRDAAFSVDRIVDTTGAAGLFVVEGRGAPKLLSQRGIGSLVEGVAKGAGAMVWLGTAPAAPAAATAQEKKAPVEKTPELKKPDRKRAPVEEQTRKADVFSEEFVPPPAKDVVLVEPENFHQFTLDEKPPPARKPLPIANSIADLKPTVDTEVPSKLAGDIRVRGIKCARGHLNDPRVAFCRLCGLRMNETQIISEGQRPPLGFLVVDDGQTFILHGDCVIGREPETSDSVRAGLTPIRLADRAGGMSRAHAEIRLIEWDVAVVDLGSTNGTHVRMPGYRDWRTLQPRQPFMLAPGAEISIGGRTITFDSPHAHL
ncbi:FHA domain-containing protein [Antrihabitans sp. YC2-6]|uniref:FHA domain-containing protein n=1 Tax=Antrihabitans sp. YC2-6 TaxID=2799498 RepID=UPI0018F4BB87|nr:FHA domain-containing protein [Antrihabitans sp. YC2-6]MBJ8347461.1 FHA domain-containing protein [Antrihabitans sp. YC2-6]